MRRGGRGGRGGILSHDTELLTTVSDVNAVLVHLDVNVASGHAGPGRGGGGKGGGIGAGGGGVVSHLLPDVKESADVVSSACKGVCAEGGRNFEYDHRSTCVCVRACVCA